MLSFLLLLHASSKEYFFPKFTKLLVGPQYDQNEANDYNKQYKDRKKETCEHWSDPSFGTSDTFDYDECIALLSSLVEFRYSDGSNINKDISDVSSSTQYLFIEGSDFNDIDLNKLKNQMKVNIDFLGFSRNKDYKYNLIENLRNTRNFFYRKSYKNANKLNTEDEGVLNFNGGLKDKVSFLTIYGSEADIKFKDELNIHTLYLKDCDFSKDTSKINTNFLIVDDYADADYIISNTDSFNFDQFSFILDYHYSSEVYNYDINYTKTGYKIIYKQKTYIEFPYSRAHTFNIISKYNDISINLEEGVELDKVSILNISVMERPSTQSPMAKKLEKAEIIIKYNGWDNIPQDKAKPNVTLTYDREKFSYTLNENDPIQIDDQPQYVQPPENSPSGGDNPKSKSKTGMIVGIVVAVVAVIVIVIVVVIVVRKKKTNQSASEGEAKEN